MDVKIIMIMGDAVNFSSRPVVKWSDSWIWFDFDINAPVFAVNTLVGATIGRLNKRFSTACGPGTPGLYRAIFSNSCRKHSRYRWVSRQFCSTSARP